MRILISEFIEAYDTYSENLRETTFKFDDVMTEIGDYVAETMDSFQGKTADTLRETIQTRFEGIYSKYINIDDLMVKAISDIAMTGDDLFGSDGVIDIDCVEEVKVAKQKEISECIDIFEEENRILSSVDDLIDLGRIGTRDLEDLGYQHRNYCDQIIRDAFEFDEYIKERMLYVHEAIHDMGTEFGISISSSITGAANSLKQLKDNFLDEEDTRVAIMEKAQEDFDDGKITKEDLQKIREAAVSNLGAIIRTAVLQYGVDDLVSSGFAGAVNWLRYNTTHFMNMGLIVVPVSGGNVIKSVPPSAFSSGIRNFARYGLPVVGAAVDFEIQVYQGEDVDDAAVKAVVHTGVAIGAAKVGAMIGTAFAPGIGTAAGAVIGGILDFVAGVAINMGVDAIYDDVKDFVIEGGKKLGDGIKNGIDKVGDEIKKGAQL